MVGTCGHILGEKRSGLVCWECHKANARRWYAQHKEHAARTNTAWVERNRLKSQQIKRDYWARLRLDVVKGYGGCCLQCGEDDVVFLAIDHVENDGARDRAGRSQTCLYVQLRREDYPAGYQILCHNHNWAKHLATLPPPTPGVDRTWAKWRPIVLAHYGAMCVCCGVDDVRFLDVDHVNNDGPQRVLEGVPRGGNKLFRWLMLNNFPQDFQILCKNCNWAKSHGGCPHRSVSHA